MALPFTQWLKPETWQLFLLLPAQFLQLKPDDSTTKGLSNQSPLLHLHSHLLNSSLNISFFDYCIIAFASFTLIFLLWSTHHNGHCQFCPGKYLTAVSLGKEVWFVAFAEIRDINILIITDFNLLTCQSACKISEILRIVSLGSC